MTEEKKFELSPSIAILITGVLIAGSIVFVNLHPSQPVATNDGQLPANVTIPEASQGEHIVGLASAPIVLVEYSDFQCPYCEMVHPTLKRLVSESNGQIAWVYRQLPLTTIHPQARPAALASECVAEQLGNDGFWKFADTMFANQSKLAPAYYEQVAKELGANAAQFATCVSTEKFASKIAKESQDAQASGGTGTPYTVVVGNGLKVPISGALPYEQFAAVIEAIKVRQ